MWAYPTLAWPGLALAWRDPDPVLLCHLDPDPDPDRLALPCPAVPCPIAFTLTCLRETQAWCSSIWSVCVREAWWCCQGLHGWQGQQRLLPSLGAGDRPGRGQSQDGASGTLKCLSPP